MPAKNEETAYFLRYAVSDMGRTWNPKKTVQIAFRVPEEEKLAFEDFAREAGYNSVSHWIRELIKADMAGESSRRKEGNQSR